MEDGQEMEFHSQHLTNINISRGYRTIKSADGLSVKKEFNGTEVLTIVCAPKVIKDAVMESNRKVIDSLINNEYGT